MAFDIYQLNGIDWEDPELEKTLADYQEGLVQCFVDSPEGQARLRVDPEMGFWAAQLIHYGYTYLSATLPEMNASNLEELMTEIFPRKISLLSPNDADDAVPELVAFWEYLGREYDLPHIGAMLEILREIEPEFTTMMNDFSNFGMAGQSDGFDMSNEEDMHALMLQYNAKLLQERTRTPVADEFLPSTNVEKNKAKRKQEEKKRKAAQAARKTNRRKRK